MSNKWIEMRLGDMFNLQMGKTPDRKNSTYWNDGVNKWISIADIRNGKYIADTKETISDTAVSESGIKLIPKDTVIMSFKLSIGKVALTTEDMYCNEAIMSFIPNKGANINNSFLYYRLLAHNWVVGLNKAVKGVTLNKATLSNVKLLFPETIAKQQEIVAVLDKASELVEKRKAQLAELDALAESIFYDMFGDPVTNEKGWKKLTIEELVVKGKNAIKRGPFGGALKKEIFVDEGYLVYEQYHALNNDFSFGRYFITEDKYNELSGFAVDSNDIIISCSGVNLGKLAVIPENHKEGIINQALLKITLDNNIITNSLFVKIFTNDNFKDKYFGTNRGCAIPNFPPMSDFKQFAFICPPLQLQQQFAERIEKIEQQKQKVKAALKESEDLFQRLMQDMFNPEYHNS